MTIKMVREPSETPNIRNIDDIVGLRYAYSNQDGYVIGKGKELSNTIIGSNFTINSGRVVLQGVESDIDANGFTISVDNIATKQYYTIYYEVNLAKNSTTIKSITDTAGYPDIDSGDDLTEITTGTANLELYHFTAQNGIISNVEKLVKPIKYINAEFIENTKVKNSVNANNAVINYNGNFMSLYNNSNDILELGNKSVQKSISLLDFNPSSTIRDFTFSPKLNVGDTIEVTLISFSSISQLYKVVIQSEAQTCDFIMCGNSVNELVYGRFSFDSNGISTLEGARLSTFSDSSVKTIALNQADSSQLAYYPRIAGIRRIFE